VACRGAQRAPACPIGIRLQQPVDNRAHTVRPYTKLKIIRTTDKRGRRLCLLAGLGAEMEKKYQVFVSATYYDLKDARREVLNGIQEKGCFPASMEFLHPSNRPAWDQIEKHICECDYVVVIGAGKYGSYFNEKGKKARN